jgi:hypothetical protein
MLECLYSNNLLGMEQLSQVVVPWRNLESSWEADAFTIIYISTNLAYHKRNTRVWPKWTMKDGW